MTLDEQTMQFLEQRAREVPDRRTFREFDATVAVLPPADAKGPEITLTLPWAPSVNRIWRNVAIGGAPRTLLSTLGRMYFVVAAEQVRAQRKGLRIAGRVLCDLMLHPPTRARMDIDNRAKAVLDVLAKGGLYEDDSQVDVLIVQRGPVIKGGAVVVRVAELEAA